MSALVMPPQAPEGKEAEVGAVFKPSLASHRASIAASRRRCATMGSRMAVSKVKEPVYPMFAELARACANEDPFWKRFFETMAAGRFFKGVILRDDCLVFRARKKTTTFELTPMARSNWQNVADFFRTTCDVKSECDWDRARRSGAAVVQLTTAEINKSIKKANGNAIPEFALSLKAKYGLSPAEMSEVDVLLRYYSSASLFRPGDVVYTANKAIRDIKTLTFNEVTRRFSITAEAKAPKYAAKESYQDPITYLSGAPFTKPIEKTGGIDILIRKQLRLMYAASIKAKADSADSIAREPSEAGSAATATPKKPKPKRAAAAAKPRSRKTATQPLVVPVLAAPDPITDDDDDLIEEAAVAAVCRRRSGDCDDDDSS